MNEKFPQSLEFDHLPSGTGRDNVRVDLGKGGLRNELGSDPSGSVQSNPKEGGKGKGKRRE